MTAPVDPATRSTVLEDLRRVIRRIEGSRPFRVAPEPVERVVGGEVTETAAGALLAVRREYALGHRHGRQPLAAAFQASPAVLDLIARPGEAPPDPRGLLFLDTETTGLAGGTGTYAFLVGVGYVEDERFVVEQYFMRDLDEEPALLSALTPLLERATGIVSFNGTGFDLPLLETRFVLARRRWPAVVAQVDLLWPARRLWALRFEDCRLGTLERHVLGLERAADVSAAFIPSLYFAYLRSRQAAPLAPVFEHNRADVLSLVGLLGWLAGALAREDAAALHPADLAGIGRLWERVDRERSAAYYRAALAGGLAGAAAQWVRLRLGWWEKRRAAWESACTLWEAATREPGFDVRPWEELAKYHEHRRRDFATALEVVRQALVLAETSGATPAALGALAHRLARLDRRLSARPCGASLTSTPTV